MKEGSNAKKVLNIIRTVFTWALVVFSVGVMVFTIVSVNIFNKNDRGIFGFKFFVVQTDSMSATDFDAGDIAIAKEVDAEVLKELKEGDIITFISQNSASYGETVTHKIRRLTTDANGSPGFVTYGTTTDTDDETIVTYPYVIGKYVGRIVGVGEFFLFLKTVPGYILCILIPFLLLILSQGINCVRLFRQYRAEQMADMQAEREKLEQERAESQKMMAELLALKEQLAKQGNPAAEAPPTSDMPKETEAVEQNAQE